MKTDEMESEAPEKSWVVENLNWIYLILMSLSVVAVTLLLGVSYYLVRENRNRISEIQQQRTFALLQDCLQQNERHDNTIEAADMLFLRARQEANTPEQFDDARVQHASTIFLIEALAPKQEDCVKFVRQKMNSYP